MPGGAGGARRAARGVDGCAGLGLQQLPWALSSSHSGLSAPALHEASSRNLKPEVPPNTAGALGWQRCGSSPCRCHRWHARCLQASPCPGYVHILMALPFPGLVTLWRRAQQHTAGTNTGKAGEQGGGWMEPQNLPASLCLAIGRVQTGYPCRLLPAEGQLCCSLHAEQRGFYCVRQQNKTEQK